MQAHSQRVQGGEVQDLRRQGGRWLRSLREARGLSQLDLARLVGIDYYTFISQIEAGRGRIPPERYGVWAAALQQPPRAFVIELMRWYEPVTWSLLFGGAANDDCCDSATGGA